MSNEELTYVIGGMSWGIWATFGAAITFVLGFVEGLINPIKCGK